MNMSPYLSRIEGPPPKRDAARSNRAGDANPPKTLRFRGILFCYSAVSVPSVWDRSMYGDVAYTPMYTVPVIVLARFDYILTTLSQNSHLRAPAIKAFAAHYFVRLNACQVPEWPVLPCIS